MHLSHLVSRVLGCSCGPGQHSLFSASELRSTMEPSALEEEEPTRKLEAAECARLCQGCNVLAGSS